MFKLLRRLILFALLAAVALGGALYWFAHRPLELSAEQIDFRIEKGSSLRSAVSQIRAAGVDVEEWPFIALVRLQGGNLKVKAGSYELRRGATAQDLLGKITRGEFARGQIVFLEGRTFKELRAALDAHPHLRHRTQGLQDAEIMRLLGADGQAPEGRFFPDTYHFFKGDDDLEILRRAHEAMDKRLQEAWSGRTADLPLRTPDEALILASIVEKETGSAADRDLIAAVFINRLRAGMRLQTDPTVIYGLGERFDGNLRKVDLLTDTAYNTYTRDGLPPTPIAMPGLASLQAVMHPRQSKALYFVARGDGSSHFSESLNEHNDAVNRYQRTPSAPAANKRK